jgi:hypothetical protein
MRKTRIDRQRDVQLFVRHVIELEANHHLRRQQVCAGSARLRAEGLGEGSDGFAGLPRLDVSEPEHLRQLDVANGPRAGFLEQRNGFGNAARQVVRQTQHLHDFAAFERFARELSHDRGELLDRVRVIVAVVIGDPEHVPDARIARVEGCKSGDGRLCLAGVDLRPRLRKGSIERGRRVLTAHRSRQPQARRKQTARNQRCHRVPPTGFPRPSSSVSTWLLATSSHASSVPIGQRTSTRSTFAALPSPACTRRSFCDM